jgi:hypothetical protein
MKISEPNSFGRKSVDVGRLDLLCSITPDVGVTQIVRQHENDIGRFLRRKRRERRQHEHTQNVKEQDWFH